MKQRYGMRFHNPVCYCEDEGQVQRGGLNSGHRANHGGIRLMNTCSWCTSEGVSRRMSRRTAGRRVEKLLTKRLSKCLTECSVILGVMTLVLACSLRVAELSVVVLTYSVTYLGEVLGDVPSETWRLKPRLRGSLAQVNSNTGQGPGE
ncbi:hypothetical protein F2Q68_00016437 [Brassica cretica]|uniref:Uncharacterized protein n=2 Tax=Brassica cretica TaxID=69181 RepID=A0A8S9HP54_BRACR|nr:hypothetical protein F2Q68_00016437 [Brassica cretica]